MPFFNAIGQPRFNSPLVRFFGMKIGAAAAPSLAPEIAPSFDVNQHDDPQLYYLRGEKIAGYGNVLTSAAGFYSTAAIRNPTGSGVLVLIESINCFSQGGSINLSLSSISDLTSAGYCTPLDGRWGALGVVFTSARYTYRNDSAGPLTGQRITQLRNNVQHHLQLPIILTPGIALVIETTVVNADLTWGVVFRERQVPSEELATG